MYRASHKTNYQEWVFLNKDGEKKNTETLKEKVEASNLDVHWRKTCVNIIFVRVYSSQRTKRVS